MNTTSPLVFDRDDLPGNAAKLVGFFGCGSEADVPLARFVVENQHDRLETGVQEGKYKTALFLLYASTLVAGGWQQHCRFAMNDHIRELARTYFGAGICDDALDNPDTKHVSVRMLFAPGSIVTLFAEPNH